MKAIKVILFFQLVCCLSVTAQNWNVFNLGYRYNYKYNNNQLVSQVLFADSAEASGTDSIYYMNRIGILSPGVFIPNLPQFLQRTIKKYANGLVVLQDTAKLLINPASQPGQSWLFDSINNVTALCIAKNAQITFGISDTVKTILIGTADTLRLSKNFGVLQFPALYNKNKYYRLAGIELAATYDSVAFYGERVPNAWDIYDFETGDRFCFSKYDYIKGSLPSNTSENFSVLAKEVFTGGYSYTVSGAGITTMPPSPTITNYTYSFISYSSLSSPLRLENRMYPGQVIEANAVSASMPPTATNVVSYGLDNHGVFYKYMGRTCSSISGIVFPFNNTNTYPSAMTYDLCKIFGVGLGQVSDRITSGPSGLSLVTLEFSRCMKCAVKHGSLYFGAETFVGVDEQKAEPGTIKLYPNPFQDKLTMAIGDISADGLRVSNILGETVFQVNENLTNKNVEITLADQQNGIYLVQVFNNSALVYTKKILKH